MSVEGKPVQEREEFQEKGKKEKMSPSLCPREEGKRLYSFSIGSLAVNMRPKAHKKGTLSPQGAKKISKNF